MCLPRRPITTASSASQSTFAPGSAGSTVSLLCGHRRRGELGAGVEELVARNAWTPQVGEAVVRHLPLPRLVAPLVVDLDQVRVVFDHASRRVEVVGEEVAACAVAAGTPHEASVVLLENVTQQSELADVLDLPRVMVQTIAALGDPDPVVIGVASQKEEGAIPDVL